MKLTGFLFIVILFEISFSGNAQTLSFSGKDVPLKTVFASIKNQTGVYFFYDQQLIREAKPVTISLTNVSLEIALNEIFKDQPLSWSLEDKTITIMRKSEPVHATANTSIHASFIPVQGHITDGQNKVIADVSVVIKGKKQGTITDKNGRFLIQTKRDDILIFSSVGYGPKEIKADSSEMSIELVPEIKPLEAYIVGGNITALKRKADATSVTIIGSKTLEELSVNTIDQIYRGIVPGTNSFDVGNSSPGFPSLSIRGAAGPNGLTPIAVYIDGIEYAGGSSFLGKLDKTNIDRVEVVRGPGASAMYGTGSNGGIVQIFTNKAVLNQTFINMTAGAGFYDSKWTSKNPFQQLYNLEFGKGFKHWAFTAGGSYRSVGAYLPDGGEKNTGVYSNVSFNSGKLQVNVMARYNVRNYSISRNPYYDTALHPRTDIILEPFPGYLVPAYEYFNIKPSVPKHTDGLSKTYIVGVNLSHNTTKNWVNNLVAGYSSNDDKDIPVLDGTPLQNVYQALTFHTTTIRYFNTLTLGKNNTDLYVTILSGLEYKKYSSSHSFNRPNTGLTIIDEDPDNKNYSGFVQLNPAYKNVYLTLALRYEKNELFTAAWNPRLGITTNFEFSSFMIKPRISWGKGILAPSYSDRFGSPANPFSVLLANPDIKPQSQEGFDYGLELYDHRGRYKFEVVYYDNVLKNMITQIILGPDQNNPSITAGISANAAQVINRGWEFAAGYYTKHVSVQANFSIINSLIEDTTGCYLFPQFKGITPGTRIGNIPSHTAGISLAYNFFRLFNKSDGGSVSLYLTEVDGIRSLDHRSYNLDVAYGRTGYDENLLGYPVVSSAVFRLGIYADYQISKGLRFFVQGYNILNDYQYEYSNDYPTHGATWLFGLKFNFFKPSL